MKPQFHRKTSQEEIDALTMIMLSKSPQSFPIRYQSERGSQLTNKANPFKDKKFSVDVKGSNTLETGSHNLNQKRGSAQATLP